MLQERDPNIPILPINFSLNRTKPISMCSSCPANLKAEQQHAEKYPGVNGLDGLNFSVYN
jgi:hypothetical protein